MEAQRMCGDIEAFGWTAPLADGAWYEFRGGELVAATQWTDYPAYCGDWQMSFGSPTCQPEWPENGGYDGLGGFGGEGGDDQHVVK